MQFNKNCQNLEKIIKNVKISENILKFAKT